ncbi:hypothetical protein DCS_03329 [Drechmeria coniospora]|uniref:Uncharacterized protein n=1 Tax=Drechmeria coniospora TaxID=98403 RepID=A0A151GH25_DRECN|nr:hypothetical protein DCS_03329 [Drechmeria coniospora]KYK56331.1 hypothetical protein DCS_03329 [Drechmeria coniospora]
MPDPEPTPSSHTGIDTCRAPITRARSSRLVRDAFVLALVDLRARALFRQRAPKPTPEPSRPFLPPPRLDPRTIRWEQTADATAHMLAESVHGPYGEHGEWLPSYLLVDGCTRINSEGEHVQLQPRLCASYGR